MSTSITSIPLARELGSDSQEDEDEWEGGEVGVNAELVPPNGGTVSLLKDVNTVVAPDGRLLEVTSSGEVIRQVQFNDAGEPVFAGPDVQARSNP
jgi:hypothetical protein